MARGRKKGGYKINELTDADDIIKKIINQTNSLNKKIKSFKAEKITEHMDFLKTFLTDDLVQFTEKGTISKSKKFYENKHILWLKKSLSALHKANNHEFYGTVNKYKKEVNNSLKGVMKYTDKYLRKKGYSEEFINQVTNSKDFLAKLIMRFNEGAKSYGSDQLIDEVALTYGEDTGLSSNDMNEFLSNIEYSQNAINRINQQQEEFEEFQRLRNKR